MEFVASDEVRRIKARLDHPVIDSDGHAIEYLPLVRDILKEQAGEDAAAALDRTTGGAAAMRGLAPEQMRGAGMIRISWWGLPARNTLDRATALLPALLAARIEEMGVDHAILYPTYGLGSAQQEDGDLRRAIVRAFNTFYSEAFRGHAALLTPVGIIPMHTPDEAIAELEFATSQLGLKAFMFGGPIARPVPGADVPLRVARWLDTLGVDSVYDYDPVWSKCMELGVSPTFHTASMGWPTHSSVSSYVYNHIGMFATAGETLARSLFLGGVGSLVITLGWDEVGRLSLTFTIGSFGWFTRAVFVGSIGESNEIDSTSSTENVILRMRAPSPISTLNVPPEKRTIFPLIMLPSLSRMVSAKAVTEIRIRTAVKTIPRKNGVVGCITSPSKLVNPNG